ncbi:MAG: HlyC/CorC family transporter [Lachnospiraceae bacterium]|jgi:CBS domain containing-hemolysin-like protein|nr:HlyC/CorC family transporter [Lachnospiraceae bacterium]
MDDGSQWTWLIVVLLLLAAVFFAITETAFASVSRVRLKTDEERGDKRAASALYVTEHFDRAITTLLICTNIVHIATASIVTVYVTKRWGVSAVSISTLVTTLVVFFFGEMLPKSIARKYSEPISLATAGTLRFLMMILKPAALLLTWIGNGAARMTKGDDETSVTENDIYDIIEDMTEEGTINEEQSELISSALEFGDVTVESILTSRMDVAAIDINMPQEEILQFIKEQNHSRLPVYEGSIDNIIGILHIRKYIRYYIRRGEAVDIKPLLYEPFFVHQSTKIDDLLTIMSKNKVNLAVVTDNYGGTLGIVTDEDILEELVGEIWDEDDRAVRNVVPMTDGSYSVNPQESVLDILDELGIEYTQEQEENIGHKLMNELAYEAFPSIPVAGDSFRYLGTKISVLVMRHNRIMRVKVRRLTDEELEEDRKTAENDEAPEEIRSSYEGFAKGGAYAVQQAKGKHYARTMRTSAGERR